MRRLSHEVSSPGSAQRWLTNRRLRQRYAADWREAEERNPLVLRQLTDAGIGQ